MTALLFALAWVAAIAAMLYVSHRFNVFIGIAIPLLLLGVLS